LITLHDITPKLKNKNQILKNFIVLEGLDGSGTSTQTDLLAQKLKQMNVPFYKTYEPTHNQIGLLIHTVLKNQMIMDHRSLAYLFAADRNEHLYSGKQSVLNQLKQNKIVICDRYLFSSLAYQSITCNFDFVYKLNSIFPLPQHLVFLDTDPQTCDQRLKNRKDRQIFENIVFQKRVLKAYNKAFTYFAKYNMKIHRLNGNANTQQIHSSIWKIIQSLPIVKR
jgi:dTMP kinase